MSIGEKIRQARTAKGLSQKEVALALSMDQSQYSKIEKGKTDPSFSTVERIASALDIGLSGLFGESDPFEEIDSGRKTAIEKLKLIDSLEEEEKKAVFSIIDGLVSKKRLKDTLSRAIDLAS